MNRAHFGCYILNVQIYPNTDIEELVRCYSCNKWFKRTCVGISENAYKALVNEQIYCSWVCDMCINSKSITTIMPKSSSDNNNKEWDFHQIVPYGTRT